MPGHRASVHSGKGHDMTNDEFVSESERILRRLLYEKLGKKDHTVCMETVEAGREWSVRTRDANGVIVEELSDSVVVIKPGSGGGLASDVGLHQRLHAIMGVPFGDPVEPAAETSDERDDEDSPPTD